MRVWSSFIRFGGVISVAVACNAVPAEPSAPTEAPSETSPGAPEPPDPPDESPAEPVDTGTDPLPGCASGSEWEGGNRESPLMHPGVNCLDCHQNGEAPHFTLAGTVMGALRDVDDCNGVEGVTVRITGADGAVFELVTNAAGNFYTDREIAAPYQAEVEVDGVVHAMAAEQTDGACNRCHTTGGAYGSPGRIVAP
jgi:hypothetical protein